MPDARKTTRKRKASPRKPAAKALLSKNPGRRIFWAFLMLTASVVGFLALFLSQADGFMVRWFSDLFAGLLGEGFYILPFALAGASALLFVKRRGPYRLRLFAVLAVPVLYGAMRHLYAGTAGFEFSYAAVNGLFAEGAALKGGGLLSGGVCLLLKSAVGTAGTMIFFILFMVMAVFCAFHITPEIIRGFLNPPKYYDDELSEPDKNTQPVFASAASRRVIDIPLEGEKRTKPEKLWRTGAVLDLRPPSVRTPAEALEEMGQAAAKAPPAPAAQKPPAAERLPEFEPVCTQKEEKAVFEAVSKAASESIERELSDAQSQPGAYKKPPITLLNPSRDTRVVFRQELEDNSARLMDSIRSFGVDAEIVNAVHGPTVTRYEIRLTRGTKFSRISGLSDDIALSLGAAGVRIAPIPDKVSTIGIEVPNKTQQTVTIREVVDSREFKGNKSAIAFAVGKDISGACIIGDIARMPHILIAGTTGSGKSVCINSLLVSLLYRATPEQVRLIMIDPKMIELGIYNGIPHLLIPVVTDPKKAAGALNWAVSEMMMRYKLFSEQNVRDLASYNEVLIRAGDPEKKPLPQIVMVIDELADLMFAAANEVEEAVCRIAQMARAAGMHLVIATQRPSADVITGLMKANIPSRIAFAVASQIESRIILDTMGAEKLIGRGDMLYYPLGFTKPVRVQGCFITSNEVETVVDFIKKSGNPDYSEEVMDHIERQLTQEGSSRAGQGADCQDSDELLPAAIGVVMESGQASVSMLQRKLKLGYSRAARLVDQMEDRGIVGPFEGSKPRQILITRDEWHEMELRRTE